jgi:hypothetical protein
VSEAVDLVVHCVRVGSAVRVSEIVAVEELQTGRDSVAFTLTELFSRARRDEPLRWTGSLPVRAGRMLEDAGYDVRALLEPAAGGTSSLPAAPSSGSAPVRRTTKRPRTPRAKVVTAE